MKRMIFVNLPVADVSASRRFFGALGFTFNEMFSDENAACMVIEENIFAMLLAKPRFKDFIPGEIAEPSRGVEVLNCLSCESRAEVEALLEKAFAAGAKPWMPNQDLGFMFNGSFQDLDGHVWELAWMDPAAAANGPPAEATAAA